MPPPKRKRTHMHERARRAQLVAHALGAFSESSYDDVNMAAVARSAGISKALVYHYFPTKRHFYIAALREAARQLLEATGAKRREPSLSGGLGGAAPHQDANVRLREGLDAYLTFVEKHARAYTALLRGGVGFDAQVETIVEGTRAKFMDRLLAQVPATAALRLQVRGWIGFVEATALAWLADRPIGRDALVDSWATALMLLTQSTPSPPPRA